MTCRQGFTLGALVFILPAVVACNQQVASPSGYDRFVPSVAKAEDALTQVLAAWKRGEQVGPIESSSDSDPLTIQVADCTRKVGQRLVDFEVLGEISGEGPRTFTVRLKLENPSAEREVRYYLVGIDPLWVFRQEDYYALTHWDVCVADDR